MDKQKQTFEEMVKELAKDMGIAFQLANTTRFGVISADLIRIGYRKIPEGAVVLTDDELNEVIDTCKVSMIVTDDDGEKYISLDDHHEYTERLGKIVRQRKARIEYLEKLLDDRCDRCIERERKETAEKFAERVKASEWRNMIYVTGNKYITVERLKIDEICKELAEGK